MNRIRLFALLLALLPLPANAVSLSQAEMLLVGTVVNRSEEQEIDAYKLDDDYWIKVHDLVELTGIEIKETAKNLELNTPIGNISLPLKELAVLDGDEYVSGKLLLATLNIKVIFSNLNYALYFEVPWQPGAALAGEGKIGEKMKPKADIPAPGGSVSFIRTESNYSNSLDTEAGDFWSSVIDTGGRVGQSTWSLGLDKHSGEQTKLQRYFVNRVYDRSAARVGTNYVNLNSLLGSQDFTGAQWAYSSKGIEPYTDFESSLNLNSFLAEDIDVQQTITRSDGPPGGIAELRIDDIPIGRVRVGLNGWYEFRNIPRTENNYQTVAIWLYRRSLAEPPIAKLDFTQTVLREMLPKGEVLLRAGGGESGNALYDTVNKEKSTLGFAQARYGVTDRVTLVATGQSDSNDGSGGVIGARVSLGQHWSLALDTAQNDTANAFASELEGIGDKWEISLRSRLYQQGYRSNEAADEYDYYLRSLYHLSTPLRLGLYGRISRDAEQEETQYVKPGLFWNPFTGFMASAIPNLDGDYRYSADYYLGFASHLSGTYENQLYSLIFDRGFGDYNYAQLGIDYNNDLGQNIVYSTFNWYPFDNYLNSLQASFSQSGSTPGFSLNWDWIMRPGIELEFGYSDGYRAYAGEDTERTLTGKLRMDFSSTGRRLIPADNQYINFSRGGISGAIYDQSGNKLDVDNVKFKVDGRSPRQSQVGGYFNLSNLKPGVYAVEIDEGNLPIEYVPEKKRYQVEVARSAVTQVDFKVRAEYGAAGQVVHADGRAIANATVQAENSDGKVVSSGTTGNFGYYRLDGLTPGEYTITATSINNVALVMPVTPVNIEIKNDYLFDKNLVVLDTYTEPAGIVMPGNLKP